MGRILILAGSLCASQNKMTKRAEIKRKRFEALSFKLDESHINPKTGQIEINMILDAVNSEHKVLLAHNDQIVKSSTQIQGYFGKNKIRTLTTIPKDHDDHSIDYIKKLQRYDRIVAIDTNTQNIGNLIALVE